MLKEDISGEILSDLNDKELKSLGLKSGLIIKLKKYISENKEKFEPKEIIEKISIFSKPQEISDFFQNCLNFKGNLNDMNGKYLLELTEEKMKELGLNLGQRKKLIRYITYFKTLKIEEPKETELKINSESSEEEVSKFLKEKLGISQEAIEALGLDGESLFLFEEEAIKQEEALTQEEKEKLINFLKKEREENANEESEIKITKESSEEEVSKFLKEKLGIS